MESGPTVVARRTQVQRRTPLHVPLSSKQGGSEANAACKLDGMIGDADREIRLRVFDWLTEQRETGETLSRTSLETFILDGRRIPLVGPSGIWKPAVCELPISITTTVAGPYLDTFDRRAGTLRYAYLRETTRAGGESARPTSGRHRPVHSAAGHEIVEPTWGGWD